LLQNGILNFTFKSSSRIAFRIYADAWKTYFSARDLALG